MAEPPSSPPSEAAGAEDALSWYKAQYELLESELAEFRESSRELEQELEKDIERAEKQERILKEKADALRFEVEEWKASLEKEITTLREANRTLALKLRDSEVANDDFERQARNTTSSLEDMESKFNQAIERGVLMEEEIKMGEQEREALRIESQRLREELSELKIEAELMQDKVKKYESRHSTISSDISILESPTFDKNVDASVDSAASSPLITTPPEITKSLGEPTTEMLDPPSPPMSDASAHMSRAPTRIRTPGPATLRRTRLPSVDASSRARGSISGPSTGTRVVTGGRPSISNGNGGGGAPLRTPSTKPSASRNSNYKIPASNSLSHIRLLTAQMQRLEARVHSVRSKLPAPSGGTPPRPSSRPPMVVATPSVPTSVTVRSRKRATTQSTASSSLTGDDLTPTSSYASSSKTSHTPRLSTSGVSRLSFGTQPNGRGSESEVSRPASRSSFASSLTSYGRPVSRNEMPAPPRPISRSSFSAGTRTPIGRPPSSFGATGRGHSGSVSGSMSGIDLLGEEHVGEYRTPSRRGTFSRYDLGASVSGIPTPGSGIPMPGTGIPAPGLRRQSGSRRISLSNGSTSGGGVPLRSGRVSTTGFRKLGDLGETY
ncbi:nuclear distribution nude [Trichoderma arundinaceum]|uniref:Nuclear distribution nude n=1 Tax=Trichoderma arundinaceum TaxID=490622 RepID=A0A395NL82_TRIAR|nr:nuclear distribution nude [Trichoderma arundinaceum]